MGKSLSDLLSTGAASSLALVEASKDAQSEATKVASDAKSAEQARIETAKDKAPDKKTTATVAAKDTQAKATKDAPASAETKPSSTAKDTASATGAAAAKGTAPDAAKTATALEWESADNPYRKRYEDTRNWATQINQRFVEQGRQLEILNKKLDGTYNPETDDTPAVEQSVARQTQQAATIQKVKTSNAVAEQLYGKDTVEKLIWADNAPFRAFDDDPAVQARILASEAPVLEAVQFLKEVEFFTKYGKDTEAIKAAIRAEYETELRATVDQLVEERLKARLAKRESAPSSLSTLPASDGPQGGNGSPGPTPLHRLGNASFATFRK